MIHIGTAGWSIPRTVAHRFSGEGAHLARYARIFPCAEINSSFYRAHSRETYARWASQTPDAFRFAVKLPQEITHENALRRSRKPLLRFFEQIQGLGEKIGPLLLQLPPSSGFEMRVARQFFALLRDQHASPVVCEPRHSSWFDPRADALMHDFRINRVAADPSPHAASKHPGGWLADVLYYRLHGSPQKYWSSYGASYLDRLASEFALLPKSKVAWCIFDNTASGAAAANALHLLDQLPNPLHTTSKVGGV